MKKLIAVAVASMFASAAYAQVANTPGVPPTQPPAGEAGKLTKQPATDMPVVKSTSDPSAKPTDRAERKAARKAKRAAKVGDKPIN